MKARTAASGSSSARAPLTPSQRLGGRAASMVGPRWGAPPSRRSQEVGRDLSQGSSMRSSGAGAVWRTVPGLRAALRSLSLRLGGAGQNHLPRRGLPPVVRRRGQRLDAPGPSPGLPAVGTGDDQPAARPPWRGSAPRTAPRVRAAPPETGDPAGGELARAVLFD